MKNDLFGANGEDLYIELPIGSVLTDKSTGEEFSLLEEEQEILLLKGGRGGRGNASFKSSTNQCPKEWTPGTEGASAEFDIEIQLMADIGFIGLPNAGKSSLLNELTNAQAKVGSYAFTTLEPNLGEYHGYILADIPGLIEGASEGKGLGDAFLRHIKRTKMLVHLVSCENEDPVAIYETIRKELESYDSALADKPEIVVLSKSDIVDEAQLTEYRVKMESVAERVLILTLYDTASIKRVADELVAFLGENK